MRSRIGDELAEWVLERTMVFGWKSLRISVVLFITLIVINDQSRGFFQVTLH
jgi:hypothetical protein